MDKFELISKYSPSGSQPEAIEKLVSNIKEGRQDQVLLGVTGSGKTFTMANVIASLNRPALVLSHNKTLAAQLCSEFREYFPKNAVEYFVSYYDYYQPEAYIAKSDLYIEKDASINEEIDKLRHSATCALNERRDVIVVSSVSCIYSIGDPKLYNELSISLRPGMKLVRDRLIRHLIDINFERSDMDPKRGNFCVKGDIVDVYPANTFESAVRIEFFGDEIETIKEIDSVSKKPIASREHVIIFPATHYTTEREKMLPALEQIEKDMEAESAAFLRTGRLLEAERLKKRTLYDIEMLREIGYISGIENYSRYFDGRKPGQPPYTLLDYFPEDFLLFIDESHVTLPQVRGMYNGDRSRKDMLTEYGFRLKSAYDNRPLKFDEFLNKIGTTVFVSATPSEFEIKRSDNLIVEQIVRPTGLLDPKVVLHPVENQVEHLLGEINSVVKAGDRVLVTTLTKKFAERLAEYYSELGLKVKYLHSDIETLERMEIIRSLRMGEIDVLIGINLLREGLDIPEVSLVAILDADKEGFLRNETSLIQTIGRAARNVNGRVILYADKVTKSMQRAIDETERRRKVQSEYNKEHNITPQGIKKEVLKGIEATHAIEKGKELPEDIRKEIKIVEEQMKAAAMELEFETAAKLRDRLFELKDALKKGI
ncbi:MAG: excinuclease ABC subunit UvrB [Eubacteriales bacterium]